MYDFSFTKKHHIFSGNRADLKQNYTTNPMDEQIVPPFILLNKNDYLFYHSGVSSCFPSTKENVSTTKLTI